MINTAFSLTLLINSQNDLFSISNHETAGKAHKVNGSKLNWAQKKRHPDCLLPNKEMTVEMGHVTFLGSWQLTNTVQNKVGHRTKRRGAFGAAERRQEKTEEMGTRPLRAERRQLPWGVGASKACGADSEKGPFLLQEKKLTCKKQHSAQKNPWCGN